MKTDQLLDMLARDAGPAPKAVVAKRLLPAVLLGGLTSIVLALSIAGHLPLESFEKGATWLKLGYAVSLVLGAGWLTFRLAHPVSRLRVPQSVVAIAVVAMWLIGALSLLLAPTTQWKGLVFGETWLLCPLKVMIYSLPALAAVLWAVKGLAPTRLRQTGWACGALAGALGAVGYALSCPESSSTFVAIWYTAGIMTTAAIGSLVGPRFLRW